MANCLVKLSLNKVSIAPCTDTDLVNYGGTWTDFEGIHIRSFDSLSGAETYTTLKISKLQRDFNKQLAYAKGDYL